MKEFLVGFSLLGVLVGIDQFMRDRLGFGLTDAIVELTFFIIAGSIIFLGGAAGCYIVGALILKAFQ